MSNFMDCDYCGDTGWVVDLCGGTRLPGHPVCLELVPCYEKGCKASGQKVGILSFKGGDWGSATTNPLTGGIMSIRPLEDSK